MGEEMMPTCTCAVLQSMSKKLSKHTGSGLFLFDLVMNKTGRSAYMPIALSRRLQPGAAPSLVMTECNSFNASVHGGRPLIVPVAVPISLCLSCAITRIIPCMSTDPL